MPRWVESPAYKEAARILVEARKSAGLTQRQLAERIGRPHSVIANIERGERQIDVVEFIALARALDLDERDLMSAVAVAIGPVLEL